VFVYLEPECHSGLLFPSENEQFLTTWFVVCSNDLFTVDVLFLFGDAFNNNFLFLFFIYDDDDTPY